MRSEEIICPKCRKPWEGRQSDTWTCAVCPCGQAFATDEVTIYEIRPLAIRWVARDGNLYSSRWRKSEEAATRDARDAQMPEVVRVGIERDGSLFRILDTIPVPHV